MYGKLFSSCDIKLNLFTLMTFTQYPKVLYERRETKPSFWFGLILFFIGFFLTVVSLNIYKPALLPNELRVISLSKKQNILLLGLDEVFQKKLGIDQSLTWQGRSDTIIILNCNPFKNTLNILNIPRDTKIRISRYGTEKINFLNTIGGPIYTKKYLERFLKVHIDHYVVVNLHGLNKIIDELGGVIIDIPQRMQYQDRSAGLYINLFPGKQLLNGQQAIGFVRYRHDNLGDIGRIQRQQIFMRAVLRKLIDPVTFTKLPEIIQIYRKTIQTDLTPKDLIRVANFVRNVPQTNQNIIILPGEFGQRNNISYWLPEQKEVDKVIKKLFYDQRSFFRFTRTNPKDIKVCIFNGIKNNHSAASKLLNQLQKYGYTVSIIQNYETPVSMTKIYAQKANSEIALQVKYDIGNFGELLIGNLGPPDADVTILVGDDLVTLKANTKKK